MQASTVISINARLGRDGDEVTDWLDMHERAGDYMHGYDINSMLLDTTTVVHGEGKAPEINAAPCDLSDPKVHILLSIYSIVVCLSMWINVPMQISSLCFRFNNTKQQFGRSSRAIYTIFETEACVYFQFFFFEMADTSVVCTLLFSQN